MATEISLRILAIGFLLKIILASYNSSRYCRLLFHASYCHSSPKQLYITPHPAVYVLEFINGWPVHFFSLLSC